MFRKATTMSRPLVWIDCEMTGLDVHKDRIIEICCLITNGKLELVDNNGYESVVHQNKATMDTMNEWCIDQHGRSGLTAKVLASDPEKQSLARVEEELLAYIKKHVPVKGSALLAGNTVHMDKFFMMKDFPKVVDHLHYRLVDVSSLAEVLQSHNEVLHKLAPRKLHLHTAKADILESIAQLQWIRENYLKSGAETDVVRAEKSAREAEKSILEFSKGSALN